MTQQIKKRALHRVRILKGLLNNLEESIDSEEYCIDLLNKSLAIQESLRSLDALFLENHLRTHVKYQLRKKASEKKSIAELLKIFSLSKRI